MTVNLVSTSESFSTALARVEGTIMKNQWITTAIVAVLTLSFAAPTATAAVQPLLTGVITTKTDQ